VSNERTLRNAVEDICSWAWTDSRVPLSKDQVYELLSADGGAILSAEECREFVCGGEDGEVPEKLAKRYPLTDAYLEKEMT
jgi:hypothetical protein